MKKTILELTRDLHNNKVLDWLAADDGPDAQRALRALGECLDKLRVAYESVASGQPPPGDDWPPFDDE